LQNAKCKLQIGNCRLPILQFAICNLHFAMAFVCTIVMHSVAEKQPVAETNSPSDQSGVAAAVRAAYEARRPVYPVGGGTALDYGIAPTRPGVTLNLSSLLHIVDYTPRDMTILVEAGVRMADLAATLAVEGQQLPIDVPRAGEATIGGVVATNWNGPRRYGYGTVRDYVIGIHAVDGRGVQFKGGGRVVKNVAGYDFCKLLTGSLGTLGVITQLALKVKPLAECSATIVAQCADLETFDAIIARLAMLEAPPVAIDLVVGDFGLAILDRESNERNAATLVVRVEGTESEITWLVERVRQELTTGGGTQVCRLDQAEAEALWRRQIEFPDRGSSDTPDNSPLVLKIAVPPSATVPMIAAVLEADPSCTILAHAGNGIVYARFSRFSQLDITSLLVGRLRPDALRVGGSVVVVSHKLDGLTPHLVWGGRTEATMLMERIKQKFDPRGILNPGRFVF
jgi:glycolate oxidase FAD binding subunit